MGTHSRIAAFAGTSIIFALTAVGVAQAPREVEWRESDPSAKRFRLDDGVVKQIVVDGVMVAVSIRDERHSFAVTIDIDNRGGVPIEIRPDLVELQTISPSSSPAALRPVRADVLATRVRRDADGEAAGIDAQGFGAMTTVHEVVPVVETVPNPAAMSDPTQPATITVTNVETRVKVVPDDAVRTRAMGEAAAARARGAAESREILAAALPPTRLLPRARIAGRVYFDRDVHVPRVLVRVPLGTATVSIPFTAVPRRSLLGRRTVRFE